MYHRRPLWCALVILVAALAGCGGRPETATLPDRDVAPVPAVTFTDITHRAGIQFRHTNGAQGKKLLPETHGSGCAFLDYDGDGHQDLLLVNSCPWPGSAKET